MPMMDDQAEGIGFRTPEIPISDDAFIGGLMTSEEEVGAKKLTTNSRLLDSCLSKYAQSTPNSKICLTDFTKNKKASDIVPNFYPEQKFEGIEHLMGLKLDDNIQKEDMRISQNISPLATAAKLGAHGSVESAPRRP